MKKKVVIIPLSILISLFLILLIIPFFVNLNKFKPQIQQAIASNLNAKIDFSSVELTIFSGLGFKLNDVVLINTDSTFKDTKLLQVKEVKFNTQLFPLLAGKIVSTINIDSPNINLVKNNDINNINSLFIQNKKEEITQDNQVKKTEENTPSRSQEKNKTEKSISTDKNAMEKSISPEEKSDNLKLAKRFTMESFILRNANISLLTKEKNRPQEKPILIQNLNLTLTNIGIDKEMHLIFSTDVNVTNKDYTINGPISLRISANTAMNQSQWSKTTFKSDLNLDSLTIKYKNVFTKSNDIPFHLVFKGEAEPNLIQLDNFALNLQSLNLEGKITVHDFIKLLTEGTLRLYSNSVSSLNKILPQYKQLLSKGNFEFSTHFKGLVSNTDSFASSSKLKAEFFNSDIDLSAQETSIKPLKAQVQVLSKTLNLGEIAKPFTTSATNKDNSVIAYDNLKLNNLDLNASIEGNKINVPKLKLDIFNGNLTSNFSADLNSDPLSYQGNMNFKNIQIEDIIQIIDLKNEKSPLVGVADLQFNFDGKGTTKEFVSKTLNAKGNYLFHSGNLNNKGLLSVVSTELVKYKDKIKIPGIETGASKLQNFDLGKNAKSDLKNAKGTFEVKNGRVLIDSLIASDQGNIKLDASVGLDESLEGTALYISDKQTADSLVSLDKNFSYILNKEKKLELNLILGGSVSSPSVQIDPKNLTSNITSNTMQLLKSNPEIKKATEGAKEFLKKQGLDLSHFGF